MARESPRTRVGERCPWSRLGLTAAVSSAIALGVFVWQRHPPPSGPIESIAVLPLENLSGDPEQDYFADGMTVQLTADLSRLGKLRVISRTSVMQYKNARKPLADIARELKVDGVVEGLIVRVGDKVRITAKLVRATRDEENLWAQSYERDLHDILALQGEVARAIAAEINVSLTPQEEARLATGRRIDPAAHQSFLLGRYHFNRGIEEGLRKAVTHFEQAISRDAAYAEAVRGPGGDVHRSLQQLRSAKGHDSSREGGCADRAEAGRFARRRPCTFGVHPFLLRLGREGG